MPDIGMRFTRTRSMPRRYPTELDMELLLASQRFITEFNNWLTLAPKTRSSNAPELSNGAMAGALVYVKNSDSLRKIERILSELESSLTGLFERKLRRRVSVILADVRVFASRSDDDIFDSPDVPLEEIRRISLVTSQLATELTGVHW